MLTADLQEVSGKGGCSLPGMQGKQHVMAEACRFAFWQ